MEKLTSREEFVEALISNLVTNAPLRDLIHVYTQNVRSAIQEISDEDLIKRAREGGLSELVDHFLEKPEEG